MTDAIETIEVPDNISTLNDYRPPSTDGEEGGEGPTYHTILEVWREVLKPASKEARKKVTPQWASKMLQSYNGLTFSDMNDLRDAYFGKIEDLLKILLIEIDTDPESLTYLTAEEDLEHNEHHYKNLLLNWQLQFLQWELDWDCSLPLAPVEFAALSECHKMFFGEMGLTQFLDNIKLEFTEDDQATLVEALNELRGEQ